MTNITVKVNLLLNDFKTTKVTSGDFLHLKGSVIYSTDY